MGCRSLQDVKFLIKVSIYPAEYAAKKNRQKSGQGVQVAEITTAPPNALKRFLYFSSDTSTFNNDKKLVWILKGFIIDVLLLKHII